MKKYIITSLLAVCVLLPTSSFAQVTADIDQNPETSSCVSLVNNLKYRSRDVNTNGEVSTLQDFLRSKGYLNSNPTGYFGVLTLKAAKDFQSANNIIQTGFVGPITRAKISILTCGTSIIPPTPCPLVDVNGVATHVCPTTPTISYLSPSFGVVGTTVTIIGAKFTQDNQINFGNYMIGNHIVSPNGNTITFTIPVTATPPGPNCTPPMYCAPPAPQSITPGNYNVSITNSNGTSNKVNFIVTTQSTPLITVFSPNGGEVWPTGAQKNISWSGIQPSCPVGLSCTTVMPNYDIYLRHYYPPCTGTICPLMPDQMPYTIAKNVSGFSYQWIVGQYDWGNLAPNQGALAPIPKGQYIVQVCLKDTNTCDSSDTHFELTTNY